MLCFKHFGYATYCLPDTNKKMLMLLEMRAFTIMFFICLMYLILSCYLSS